MRWLGTLLAIVIVGGASGAAASDDVCSMGTRTMSMSPLVSSVVEDGSLDDVETRIAMEAFTAWALSASPADLADLAAQAGIARDAGGTAPRSILMCVATDPARCLPAAPPPAAVHFEIARSPRAHSASGWDVAPASCVRTAFVATETLTGPRGVRGRVDRPPRGVAQA